MGCGGRRQQNVLPPSLRRGKAAGQKTDGGGFHIAFAAGDLAGKSQPRFGPQAERGIEQPWRIYECVAMKAAQTCELGPFKPGNGAKDFASAHRA